MVAPFYTIGHGTRPLHDFVALLKSVAVMFVVDVRTVPRSRTNPQYNRETLPQSLEPFEIGYEHIASLGGLRGRARRTARAQCILGQRQFSQLCRLRPERSIS